MTTNYFVKGVGDGYLYDSNDNLVAYSKILMNSGFDVSTSNTDVRGGKGNQLQYIYFHLSDMTVTLDDVQFNLDFLANTVGSTLETGANVYTEENVTLGAGGTGTVTGTPLAIQGTALYGWVTHNGVDAVERVTFTGSDFTSSVGSENDVVCVRYYHTDAAAKQLTIYSNIIPNKLRLVVDADLGQKEGASQSVVGKVEVIVPSLQLSGAFSLAMAPDQVANTSITGRATASSVTAGGCTTSDVYAYVTRIIDSANWYDDVVALAVVGGDITLATTTGTRQLVLRALYSNANMAPYQLTSSDFSDLTMSSDAVGTATVDAAGLITGVAAGTTDIRITITTDTSIDASVQVTVPA